MLRTILFVVIMGCVYFACNEKADQIIADERKGEIFGDTPTIWVTTYDSLEMKMKGRQDSIYAAVEGTVEEVCQAMGCWLNIYPEGDESKELYITTKDHDFFVPKDIAGEEVLVSGWVYKRVTPVEELRFEAEQEGLSPDEITAIDEPEVYLEMIADGVKIYRE